MYRPTQNYRQASLNPDEREVFRQAAKLQAQEVFNKFLADIGLFYEEKWKGLLRQYDTTELYEDAFDESEDALDLYKRAGDPYTDPEESFKLMVEAMAIEERVRLYNEIIAEKEALLASKN